MAVKGCRVRGCRSCLLPELIQVGEGQGVERGGVRVGVVEGLVRGYWVRGMVRVCVEGVGGVCYLSRWRMRKARVSLLAWGS